MLDLYLQYLASYLGLNLVPEHLSMLAIRLLLALLLLSLLFVLARRYLLPAVAHLLDKVDGDLQHQTEKQRLQLASHLAHLVPAVVLISSAEQFFQHWPDFRSAVHLGLWIYLYCFAGMAFAALINFAAAIYSAVDRQSNVPYLGLAQVLKLLDFIVVAILVLSTLLGKSPVYLLSGLGALTAVLLLVFKDTILGLVASIQLATNNMVNRGDWIEMPKYGADGAVIEVALTTVKVQNWDNTITTIPTYALISDSFKNWRGMQQSGGRRIKRAIKIDIHSIGFLDEAEIQQLLQQQVLEPFFATQQAKDLLQQPHLTNLKLFRHYTQWLLQQNPKINQDMTLMVRQLESNEVGLPLEIYCFSADKVWANYEQIQAEIFETLFATLPLFTLSTFQRIGGRQQEP
ncbi:mechanosensitive ion channel family protein [Rheinheimera sp.]|uniref:mechanosensitive ion channel family protein n=1 Tax=Rheinheimera sp. TaxID=1869214 RepID=UPI002636C794|nr:mechanosensitive ion channel domain-containing protein [Rheinheimera sp.]MCA1931341.1 mechanosensitive ion channel family protein [Rheinheimera sp.]